MVDGDIDCFAELLLAEYESIADMVALKRARSSRINGDFKNQEVWLEIMGRIRELRNAGEAAASLGM